MTGVAPTPIAVISGRFGSSENVAVQVRDDSSGHVTAIVVAVDVTATAPGRSSLVSRATVCAAEIPGTRTAAIVSRRFLLFTFYFRRLPRLEPLPRRVVHGIDAHDR